MFIFFFKSEIDCHWTAAEIVHWWGLKQSWWGQEGNSLSSGKPGLLSQDHRVKQFSIQVPVVLSYAQSVQSVHVNKISSLCHIDALKFGP